ncbi:ATPase components of ABC transporter with duplicated ATPase domain [Solimicrobium silvestre]|uniref:Probable ATP-binding protein YheS n=2 Tax=Solimicrobium silvestre TaxID=2099400 RepID=A0A2S9GUB1_9BURK|nr:ATPase components of ABC transporter with duplicated ATPase domain [Solimicrobium silvestre]
MRGTKPLFEGVDLTLNPREKIGLIGSNGAGKSSLFAMLRNEIHSDQGSLDFPAQWQVAYVAQETPALERSAIDYAIDGDTRLRKLETKLAELEEQEATDENGNLIAEVYIALADADAYTVQSRAEQLLLGLGFTMAQMTQSVASFSGGWRMRLNLAQALMCPSDLLLLDEPTNHLDLDAIIWLEEWLKRYAGTLVIISHDRDFLDGVVNVIVHIDERKLKRYGGNYSSFERQRLAQLVLAQGLIEKQNRQRAHLISFIDRFKAKASKAKQAQSRVKALARMDELAPLRAAAEFSFEFKEPLNAPNPLLVLEDVSAGYHLDEYDLSKTKIIVDNINFSLQIGQRIGLLGVNGAGKSTLIKTIAGELNPVNGVAHIGKGLTIGYFAQHQVEMLRHDESPLWHLIKIAPNVREQELRNFLGSFNFPGQMVTSPIKPFSGGEKARLALALIVWQRPNLLLLDEPTNHLDLETREALTDALAQFEGTVVLVSHDRHLLRATTDQFIIVADGELKPFDGDLDDYKDWLLQNKLATAEAAKKHVATSVAAQVSQPTIENKPVKISSLNPTQKKALEAKVKRLDEEIEKFNRELTAFASKLEGGDMYEEKRKEELKALLALQATTQKNLELAESEWLSLNEQLEG